MLKSIGLPSDTDIITVTKLSKDIKEDNFSVFDKYQEQAIRRGTIKFKIPFLLMQQLWLMYMLRYDNPVILEKARQEYNKNNENKKN
jgi:hypothetical protein